MADDATLRARLDAAEADAGAWGMKAAHFEEAMKNAHRREREALAAKRVAEAEVARLREALVAQVIHNNEMFLRERD